MPLHAVERRRLPVQGLALPEETDMDQAIVTGHSRGLGAAITSVLRDRGIPVLAVSRNTGAARSSAAASPGSGALTEVALDLADPQALVNWLASGELASWAEPADRLLLINNAGTLGPVGAPGLQQPVAIASAVSLNVSAALMLAAACSALPGIGSGRTLRVLQVSSGAARNAYPGWSVYCATKAALDHHARAVQLDAPSGVSICSLAPGVVDTEMQASIRATPAERFPLRERFVALKHDGALAAPAQTAARMVSYLLSDAFGTVPVADLRELS